MKSINSFFTFLFMTTASFAQERTAPPMQQRPKHDGALEKRKNDKYSLMDSPETKQTRGSYQYQESLYKTHSQPLKTPEIKTYRFKKDKYGVPVKKKN